MTKPMIRIHDTLSNEIIDREMTEPEYQLYLAEQKIAEANKKAYQDALAAKTALLEKLGITEDEAKLLLS